VINWVNRWPETQARLARWALLLSWLTLIAILLKPELAPAYRSTVCADAALCRPGIGNDLFWNIGLPLVILAIVLSHELWRRICPLSFVSQLFRALGWQRTVLNRAGKAQVASVGESSWLARHHIQLQWSLLISGLSLRLLIANSDGLILAMLCAAALLAALVSGWAYGGKAFCQYLCPFAPAQQILSGPRSLLSSQAHVGSTTKTTQSMCRTVGTQGQDISTCVACAKPCFDIDAERSYWQTLRGKRGMSWAWYSYPGLILAFFLLMQSYAPAATTGPELDYIGSHLFAYDGRLAAMAWQSMLPAGWPELPRILAVPALLSAGGLASERLFHQIEQVQVRHIQSDSVELAQEQAIHRTRLLATFAAINTYFFASGGPLGSFELHLLIMGISSIWLYRSWDRNRGLYERESTSTSLRKRLAKLGADLQPLLAGRLLDDLSPAEVFVLANALPVQETSQRRSIYLDVLRDLISQGSLERLGSLKALSDLRNTLGLDDADHQSALEILSTEDERLTSLSADELAGLTLCRNAAAQELSDLMLLSGTTVLYPDKLDAYGRERLARIQTESGLDDISWAELLREFGPGSEFGERQLNQRLQTINQALARRQSLEDLSKRLPLAAPLVLSLERDIARFIPDLVSLMNSTLVATGEDFPSDNCLDLLRSLSSNVLTFLSSEDATTTAINSWLERRPASALPAERQTSLRIEAGMVLEELWLHPDPNVALWALMVLRQLDSTRAQKLHQMPRTGLPISETLTAFLEGEQLASREILMAIADHSLIRRLEPGLLLSLHRLCNLENWRQGDPIDRPGCGVLILLSGHCSLRQSLVPGSAPKTLSNYGPGTMIGLADYFSNREPAKKSKLVATENGCTGLMFSRSGFNQLLDLSPSFEQSLIRELAVNCESLQQSLLTERQNRQHQRMRDQNDAKPSE
jgi:CRP-like cAMP-binding protein